MTPTRQPCRVRNLFWLDEVAPPHIRRFELELHGEPLDDPLHRIVAQRAPAATDEARRDGVRIDEESVDMHRRQHIRRQHVADDDSWLTCPGAGVRADVMDEATTQAAELSIG